MSKETYKMAASLIHTHTGKRKELAFVSHAPLRKTSTRTGGGIISRSILRLRVRDSTTVPSKRRSISKVKSEYNHMSSMDQSATQAT